MRESGIRSWCVCAAKWVLRRRRVCERQVDIRVCARACGCVCCVPAVATWLLWLRTVDGGTRRVAWRAWTTTGGKWLRGRCGVWATAAGGRAPTVCWGRGWGCGCSRMRWACVGGGVGSRDVWAAGAVWAVCGGRVVCGFEECDEPAVWCVVGMLVGMECCVMGECRAMVVECVWDVWQIVLV